MEKFKVETEENGFIVVEIETGKPMTGIVPDREIAKEICQDFNLMSEGDFTPLWGGDLGSIIMAVDNDQMTQLIKIQEKRIKELEAEVQNLRDYVSSNNKEEN